MSPSPESRVQWGLIQAIMVGLLVWGGYLAIGAVRAGGNHPTLRGLIVLGCSSFFLAFWLIALLLRKRRLGREAASETDRSDQAQAAERQSP